MSKKTISNGVTLKVENRSGFDKSFFNALTTGVGTITPLAKQLVLPNSSGKCRVKISAQLPPLATDAFLRCHLKLESFFVPLRLCYGGFESWFCGREIYDGPQNQFLRAQLPRFCILNPQNDAGQIMGNQSVFNRLFASSSLADYFGVYLNGVESSGTYTFSTLVSNVNRGFNASGGGRSVCACFNVFPWIAYQLIYDEYYRNKIVERPLFSPPSSRSAQGGGLEATQLHAYNRPYIACGDIIDIVGGLASGAVSESRISTQTEVDWMSDKLLNGSLSQIRQRNYGDDYFTAATPTAQEGNPVQVTVTNNAFTISALRLSNALQEFSENQQYASPDYIQTLSARYGASLKAGIAQKPILLGSADFPMYTSGVEQTAQGTSQSTNNPFDTVGSRYGRGHAEGTEFVCDFNADEPGYFMVLATLAPEAQYFQGNARDMMMFNAPGSLVDLPCGLLENIGNDPISTLELTNNFSAQTYGFVQRYLWHKLGNRNQVHGLMRGDESLGSFVVQRKFNARPSISSSFLKISTTDLDNVAAVSAGVSKYGVMIDSAIDLFVSEPLSESAIPSLADPATEHGRSVYVKTGGTKLA